MITSLGLCPRRSRASASSVSLTTAETAPASRISRIVCCWGKINRPLGALLSMGTTRTARSRGFNRSAARRFSVLLSGRRQASRSFSSLIPSPVYALTETEGRPFFSGASPARSHLLYTIKKGIFRFRKLFASSVSSAPIPAVLSTTKRAISDRSSTFKLFCTRSLPRLPSSSMPGVSIRTIGPSGSSSIAL